MNLEKVSVNNVAKVSVNILYLPVNVWKNHAREPQKCTWTVKKVPVKLNFAREQFQKKVSVNLWKLPVNIKILCFFVTFCEKVPVNCEKCPWKFPKKCPWTHPKVPVKASKKVPVNAPSYPWISTKKCPWTQKSTRERRPKNGVHGHFWCSRGKKKTLISIG